MLIFKHLSLCAIALFVLIDAEGVQKIGKREDEKIETYVIQPSDYIESEATTIIPPLVEGEPSVQIPPVPETISNQESSPKIPEEPVNQPMPPYSYYPSPYQWTSPYMPQYLSSYALSQENTPNYAPPSNVPTAYVPYPTEYQGILVPIQSFNPTATPPPPPPPPAPQSSIDQQHSTQQTSSTKSNNKLSQPARNNFDLAVILQALLPPSVLHMIVAWSNFILNSFTVMAFAGMITSAICSLTPICTLTFGALPISVRKQFIAKMENQDGTEVTTIQRVRRAADMVSNALDKYEKLQKSVATIQNTINKSKSP